MATRKISKSIEISASAEKIWAVLTEDELTRIWYSEFAPGVYAKTDWQQGNEALFMDSKGDGIAGRITKNRPGEELIIKYEGMIKAGEVDYDSEWARNVKGTEEIYRLNQTEKGQMLLVEVDMAEEYFQMMDEAWEKALQKIKHLAEG